MIPIFLRFMPEAEPFDFLISFASAFFSFLGITFFTLSFLGASFSISLTLVSVFGVLNFLAGSFIPVSLCLKPSVAVLLNEGLEVFLTSTLSFAFLSLAVLLNLLKSKPPNFSEKPFPKVLDFPEKSLLQILEAV